jgi:uncharacterized integral membrane protein
MTQPGQPPQGPIQPSQGGAHPTSAYPTTGGGQPAYSGAAPNAFPPGEGTPHGGRSVRQGPGWATYLFTILAAIIAIAVAVFIAQNTDKTTIDFFGSTTTLSLAAALGIALGAGFLIGLLLGLLPAVKAKRELRQIRRANR